VKVLHTSGWVRRWHRQRGSALIAVYWLIAILTLGVFATAQVLLLEVDATAADQQAFRAEQLAAMALAVAANPRVERGDPVLRQQLNDQESFEGRIHTEGGRLHLNALLQTDGRLIVERLFELWGVERDFAIEVVDRLVDWVDADDIKTGAGGAENYDYTKNGLRERPYNKRFRSLDEVLMVPGMEQIAARRPGWRDAFTLYSSGKLDLNEATPEALMAMFSASEETVQQFLEGRAGADGELYTSDDYRLQSVEEGLALLGSSGPEADAVANRLSVSDPVFRLVGIGRVNDMVVEQTVVISSREGNPKWIDHRQRRLR
jgi:general secretion pathway protein K